MWQEAQGARQALEVRFQQWAAALAVHITQRKQVKTVEAAAVVVIVLLAVLAQADKDLREEMQFRQLAVAVVAQVALVQ